MVWASLRPFSNLVLKIEKWKIAILGDKDKHTYTNFKASKNYFEIVKNNFLKARPKRILKHSNRP